MEIKKAFNFLSKLKRNNNKVWFDKNKETYQEIRAEWVEMVGKISEGIGGFDDFTGSQDPKNCTFRINKDIRFSKDKTPYKTHLGAYFAKGGKKSAYAGYYLHLEPKNSFLAGGVWMPEGPVLERIRQEIDYSGEELMKILKDKNFKKLFKELEGDQLTRPPKNYSADHPHIALLKFKSLNVIHYMEDKQIESKNFIPSVIKVYKAMKPLNDFLNRAIETSSE